MLIFVIKNVCFEFKHNDIAGSTVADSVRCAAAFYVCASNLFLKAELRWQFDDITLCAL